ncbi:hypothetical protein [Rhodococcus sp. IEGM 1379]|uniref:hypothetical protein n=1 Tax=Rhodococcus sp. IEGM 1379 TaxID=3047086 RepID=UPI0024B7A65B|nr:hypothetical protein [Rhodococcus sp. IEGM 1379]MDI9916011.1 hypothetical protein [Rhodococcus sp. IEGM 1379]
MNEEESKAGQRIRRRASRSAGPTGADVDAASTVVHGEKAPQKPTTQIDLGKRAPEKEDQPVRAQVPVPAPVASVTPGPASEPGTPAAKPAVSKKLISGIAIASIVAISFAVVLVTLLVDRSAASNAEDERAAYVAGARTTALNLTTLHSETAGADLDKFLAGTTKEFQSQLDGRKDSFVSVLGQVGVQTDGEILEAGLEKSEGDCGTSLVAVRAMQKNTDQPEPEERNYRLRITMCDTDGQLLASNVEFVP